ncbi:MAG: GIY-YIG nuclease family protein [Chloroflexi bacterium]|nr:GIY-YIG nuclease family protein [Chloroflexota bacterium]
MPGMPDLQHIPRGPGTYMLVLRLPKRRRLAVGRLGDFEFPAGYYLYAGSAQGGLRGRVLRHLRADKKRHWHIDYLNSGASGATVIEVWWLAGQKRLECEWAAAARRLPGASAPAPGFGASDCGCSSHLLRVDRKPDPAGMGRQAAISTAKVGGL